ncbi:MAG TPA: penicillin-binding protein 2 [Acidimicrobiales bacterium]|nr:penicillin-binding protein 2 [Acidimicrobiales bacterium]
MNRQIRLLGLGLMVLFAALFLQLNWLQIVHANALDHNPLNGRAVVKEYTLKRGNILSADGVTLATSVPTKDSFKYLRKYPTGSLFEQVTGYYSFTYGSDGAERSYDKVLTGKKSPFRLPTSISGLRNLLTNTDQSQSITLTVLDKLQTVAQQQLKGRVGSAVAIDPRTGSILAMYSNPTFDPNQLAGHNLKQVEANYKAISAVAGGPFNSPAYRQTWFPGSSFKIVTSSAVYDHQPALATKTYPRLPALKLPQSNQQLHNFAGEVCGGQLLELFTVSCNTGYGQIGLDLGADALYSEAHSFGFDQTPPIDLPFAVKSNFPAASTFKGALPFLAYSAIGQEDVTATPLQMALVGAGIANGGVIMAPHILAHVTDSQGQVVSTYSPTKWIQATSAATASQVTKLMISVVNSPNGTGVAAQIPGVQVAGKTGTAQTGTGKIDAWFVAFAPAQNPQIAVAVVLPDQPSGNEYQGGTLAAPIAKALISTYLASHPAAPTTTTTTTTTPLG